MLSGTTGGVWASLASNLESRRPVRAEQSQPAPLKTKVAAPGTAPYFCARFWESLRYISSPPALRQSVKLNTRTRIIQELDITFFVRKRVPFDISPRGPSNR